MISDIEFKKQLLRKARENNETSVSYVRSLFAAVSETDNPQQQWEALGVNNDESLFLRMKAWTLFAQLILEKAMNGVEDADFLKYFSNFNTLIDENAIFLEGLGLDVADLEYVRMCGYKLIAEKLLNVANNKFHHRIFGVTEFLHISDCD